MVGQLAKIYTSFKITPYHLDNRRYISKINHYLIITTGSVGFFNYPLLGPAVLETALKLLRNS